MSLLEQKEQLLKELELWFQSQHPGDTDFQEHAIKTDVSLAVKSIMAVSMCEEDVIRALEEVGLEPSIKTHNGFQLWQLALMHGRKELAQRLHHKQDDVSEHKTNSQKKPKRKK